MNDNSEIEKPMLSIDRMNFSTLEEFYDEVSNKLIPNVNWGRNLDAFNDILRGGFGTPSDGFVLVWKNSELSRERLGYPETIRQLEKRKLSSHPSHLPSLEKENKRAKNGDGATVFDWLVEIIKSHDTIDIIFE